MTVGLRRLSLALGIVAALAVCAAPTAFAESAKFDCSCCPATCLGGNFYDCIHYPDQPKGAVTCFYVEPLPSTKIYACVSCINQTTSDSEQLAAQIFAPAEPATP